MRIGDIFLLIGITAYFGALVYYHIKKWRFNRRKRGVRR